MLSATKALIAAHTKRRLNAVWLNFKDVSGPSERQIAESLSGAEKLHLGCGSRRFEGWANIDIAGPPGTIRWNLTRPIPGKSNSIRFIYSEHFLEHITRAEAAVLLKNCFDLLMPGGIIRISTPNLKFLIEQYGIGRVEEWRDMGWSPATPAQMLNEGLRLWGHRFVYDNDELSLALREAGFLIPRVVQWRESEYDELKGRETRPYHGDLIVEATK